MTLGGGLGHYTFVTGSVPSSAESSVRVRIGQHSWQGRGGGAEIGTRGTEPLKRNIMVDCGGRVWMGCTTWRSYCSLLGGFITWGGGVGELHLLERGNGTPSWGSWSRAVPSG